MFKKIFVMMLFLSMLAFAGFVEKQLVINASQTENALSTLSTAVQNGSSTYLSIKSSNASDVRNITIYYMNATYDRKVATYTLNGDTAVVTNGTNYQYVIPNGTKNGSFAIELQNATFTAAPYNATKYCPNYTNVYKVEYTNANYTNNMSITSANNMLNTNDGTTATIYSVPKVAFVFTNDSYPTTLWYYYTPPLNLTGIVNSTELVLPAGYYFTSTTAFTISSVGLPGTVTVTPNNNTRTYNLTSNNTAATYVFTNTTAVANANTTSILYLSIQPAMKDRTINATLTVNRTTNTTVTTGVYIGATFIGTLNTSDTTKSFNVSQALLANPTTLTFLSNSTNTTAQSVNITSSRLVYRNMTASGWYVIPSANFVQNQRVIAAALNLSYCTNGTITANLNNITTENYTATGTKKDATDFAFVTSVNLSASVNGTVTINDSYNNTIYTIPDGSSTPTDNGASYLCTNPTGCAIKNLFFGGDSLFKLIARVIHKDGTNSTLAAIFQAAGSSSFANNIIRAGPGERLAFYAHPYVNNTNVSLFYDVG